MFDIDDLLRTLDTSIPQHEEPQEAIPSNPSEDIIEDSPSENSSTLIDEDINSILEDNGFVSQEDNEDADYDEDFEIDSDHTYDDEDNERNTPNEALSDIDALAELRRRMEEDDFPQSQSDDNEESSTEELDSSALSEESSPANNDALIPLNSPTLLMDESTTRFSGAKWFNEIQKSRVIIAGIGGIGSNCAFQLARMIPASITLYDDDNVEMVNMAGQLYSTDDIGMSKVSAIANMISKYTSMRQIYAIKGKFTENTDPGDIMICGFDNMTARKTFFYSWIRHIQNKSIEERKSCLYIDGRLSIDTLQILCIRGDDTYNINKYQNEFLFSDSEADATVCSMKQTTYLACMIGSLMVNLFTNFIANTLDPIIPYDLPFFTQYEAQNMIFKTES